MSDPQTPEAKAMVEATPGPWAVNPISAWVEVPFADAPICAMLWPTDLRSEAETFANASLIAAAPELLAGLEQAVFYLESAMKDTNWCDAEEAMPGLRAAIAKARQP